MNSTSNENERSYNTSDRLSKLLSTSDEISDMKIRRDVVMTKLSKIEIESDDLLSSVVGLYENIAEKTRNIDDDAKDLEIIGNIGEWLRDNANIEKENRFRSNEDTLTERINQLNHEKDMLSDMENDLNQNEKEKLDLEGLIDAAEAELKRQNEMLKELSSSTLSKEIAAQEAECRLQENECLKFQNESKTESLELQSLIENNNIIMEKVIIQETQYRNQVSLLNQMDAVYNNYKAKYQHSLEKNKKVMLKLKSIEEQREDAIHKVNLKINHDQAMFAKLQSAYDEINNIIKSEFGDIESVEQVTLEAKAKLTKLEVDCQTIDSAFNAACAKKVRIEERESKILAKTALQQPEGLLEPLPNASNRNITVETKHQSIRKNRKSLIRRPKQAANAVLNISSSLTYEPLPSRNNIVRSLTKNPEKAVVNLADSSISTISPNARPETADAVRKNEHAYRSLHLLLDDN